MRNPSRRNKNIGTSKQGFGKSNRLKISHPNATLSDFYERLENYKKETRIIQNHEFIFIIEETRHQSKHACSIADLEKIVSHLPKEDFGDLKYIVLRQPKRKEQILSSVWGRLIYAYEFEGEIFPAIIIEAADYSKSFKWSKKLSPEWLTELNRLKDDGHKIKEEKRHFTAPLEIENVRNTQLYRTLIHEFGHYVHYLEVVERPETPDEEYEEWEKRWDFYLKVSTLDKESFANTYADKLKKELTKKGVIPFEPIE